MAGLRPEIRMYLGLNMEDDMTLQQVYFLAKKFEAVNKSDIWKKRTDFQTELNRGK